MISEDTIRKRLAVECDNYDKTVQALKAVANELLWDDGKRAMVPNGSAYFGRRMSTSKANRITVSGHVTPDLVIRRDGKYGAITEAKITLPRDEGQRAKDLIDLQKYDDDLVGWDTPDERLAAHDLILIVDHFIGRAVRSHINDLQKKGIFAPTRAFALVTFAVLQRATEEVISLDLLEGRLSDETKQMKMAQQPLAIPLSYVVANPKFAHIQLYDHRPPPPILMNLIHEIINRQLTKEERRELAEKNEVRKAVNIGLLRHELAKGFGPGDKGKRVPEIPRAAWVREAMDLFRRLGWVTAVENERDAYTYVFKRRRDPLRQLRAVCVKQLLKRARRNERQREKENKSLPLFRSQVQEEREEDL